MIWQQYTYIQVQVHAFVKQASEEFMLRTFIEMPTEITPADISQHSSRDNVWIVIDGKVNLLISLLLDLKQHK